jgi:hypothetical protein
VRRGPGHVFCGEGDGIFCDDGFTCGGMCCNKHRVSVLEMIDCFFLEIVEFEGILSYLVIHRDYGDEYLMCHFRN